MEFAILAQGQNYIFVPPSTPWGFCCQNPWGGDLSYAIRLAGVYSPSSDMPLHVLDWDPPPTIRGLSPLWYWGVWGISLLGFPLRSDLPLEEFTPRSYPTKVTPQYLCNNATDTFDYQYYITYVVLTS